MHPIPFNRPYSTGKELAYITKAIQNNHISGDGAYTKLCHEWLGQQLGSPALLTTSCTDALELAAILLDISPGDEVIVPSFTFVSTINAFVLRGAIPRFADIRSDTLNIDERHIEQLITPRTKAIVPVHYAGVACEMDSILEIAQVSKFTVVEDAAHALMGRYKGRPLGALGSLGTLSFHETKNFSCGEGGALIVNDPCLLARAEIIREKGTNRSRYFRGEVDKYNWVDIGSSFLPSDMLAAYLYGQLQSAHEIMGARESIWNDYYNGLKSWAERYDVGLPHVPDDCQQAYHLFYLILPSEELRDRLISYLKELKINSVFHYQALHQSPMGRRFDGMAHKCPVTDSISKRMLRLPFYNGLSLEDRQRVVDAVANFRP